MQDSITEIDAPSWAQLRAFLKENEERAELASQKREAERKEAEAKRAKEFAAWEKKQKAIEKRLGIVEDHWSKLIEALVGNQLVKKLAKRGIKIHYTMQNVKDRTENRFEFDVIGVNGDTVVIVEVKTTLDCEDVSDFLTKKMPKVKSWLTQYAGHKIIGAVAYVHNKNKAAEFAEKKGLFVIMGINDTIEIKNNKDFIPREW